MCEGREWRVPGRGAEKETALLRGGSSLGRGYMWGGSKVSEGNWEKASAAGCRAQRGEWCGIR